MRKIKFTQQAFEERLDKILTDFPIMDVSQICTRCILTALLQSSLRAELASFPLSSAQRSLRQESLQARAWTAQHCPPLDCAGRQGLLPPRQVRRQSLSMQTIEEGRSRSVSGRSTRAAECTC